MKRGPRPRSMPTIIVSVVLGLGLGLSLAAPPGPMNALIAREASRHGAPAGMKMGMAAPVADVLFLAILLVGAQFIIPSGDALRVVAAVGALVLAYFAVDTWRAKQTAEEGDLKPMPFGAAFVAAITNPYQVAWWLTGGFVFLQAQGLWGIGGLLVGIFGWVVAFSWLMAHGARRWAWFTPTVRIASTLLLAVFAGMLLAVAAGWLSVGT